LPEHQKTCAAQQIGRLHQPTCWAELASHRQVLVILQAAAEIGELNGRARPSDASAFVRMKFLLTRIHEHAIAVGKALAAARLIWLAAIIEGYRVGPDILDAVTLLLAIVLPVIAVPVENRL
jgi:hypothetical protein